MKELEVGHVVMKFIKKYLGFILPGVLIVSALGIGGLMIWATKKPEKKKPQRTAYSVDVMSVEAGRQPIKIQATGTVIPALQITLRSRVSGEVIDVAGDFINGGFFTQGDVILALDPVDYQLALEQKKAELAVAEYQLKLEEGKRDIARREWELLRLDDEISQVDRDLALRIPQIKYRMAQLKAARAELEKASLDLTRTEIRAPFDAVVVERLANLGTQARVQETLAVLAGSDEFYVRASVPVDCLQWMTCDPENGSFVTITRSTGVVRKGRVVRLESALEEKGRMARVLISVKDPLKGEQPLLLQEYVRIEIDGISVEHAIRIPRSALHDDQRVWLATSENMLEIRDVDVIWRNATEVFISAGLADGDRLILTPLSTPIQGMRLRVDDASTASLSLEH